MLTEAQEGRETTANQSDLSHGPKTFCSTKDLPRAETIPTQSHKLLAHQCQVCLESLLSALSSALRRVTPCPALSLNVALTTLSFLCVCVALEPLWKGDLI